MWTQISIINNINFNLNFYDGNHVQTYFPNCLSMGQFYIKPLLLRNHSSKFDIDSFRDIYKKLKFTSFQPPKIENDMEEIYRTFEDMLITPFDQNEKII